MIAPLIAGAIVILLANRVGHWLDNQPGEPGWYEWDFTMAGIFIASIDYLVIDHLTG